MVRQYKSTRRKRAVRFKIKSRLNRLRLSVFRSNRYIYTQIIDDEKGKTLVVASEFDLEKLRKTRKGIRSTKSKNSMTPVIKKASKTERAKLVGKILAQRALKAGIKKVVFDRDGYKYHGRVRALAEGAREGGLEF